MDLSNHIKVSTKLLLDAINYKIIKNDECENIYLQLKNDIDNYKTVNIIPNSNTNNVILHFITSVFTPYWNNDIFKFTRKNKHIFPLSDMILDSGILQTNKIKSFEISSTGYNCLEYSISIVDYLHRGKIIISLLSKVINLAEFKDKLEHNTSLHDIIISCHQTVSHIHDFLDDCEIYIPDKYNNLEKEIKIYTNAYNRGIHIYVYKKYLKMLEEIEDIGCSPPIINIPVLQKGGYFYRESKEEFDILQSL